MQVLQWIMQRLLDSVGGAGFLAMGLAMVAMLYSLLLLWPAQERLATLENTLAMESGTVSSKVVKTPAQIFLADFPSPDMLASDLQLIHEIANNHGLSLNEVAYKKDRRPDNRVERYYVDLIMIEPYQEVRMFIADVLAALPRVSLDKLIFVREDLKEGDVNTSMRLTLHMVH